MPTCWRSSSKAGRQQRNKDWQKLPAEIAGQPSLFRQATRDRARKPIEEPSLNLKQS
jgi:hypothetical protein